MFGAGHIARGNQHQHFVFRVSQRNERDWGRLEYWVNDSRRCSSGDHGYDHDRNHNGSRDDHYDGDRNRRNPPNRFQATSITEVVFSDDPDFSPRRRPGGKPPTVDSVTFKGTGRWNGRAGYTFEAEATDQGEPGRGRDTFALTVRDAKGAVVTTVTGTLSAGNIQSTRLLRGGR
jgi:hypothetical protein